jgi:hypothetical protein
MRRVSATAMEFAWLLVVDCEEGLACSQRQDLAFTTGGSFLCFSVLSANLCRRARNSRILGGGN